MSDQGNDVNAPAGEPEAQVAAAPAGSFQPIGANELRLLVIPRRMFGYDQANVDEALDRAAHTIDNLVEQAKHGRDEIDELQAKVASLHAQLAEAARAAAQPAPAPSPAATTEAAVGEVLTRAHSLAEKHLRKAREEASTIVTAARVDADSILSETTGERSRLERLLHVAETEVEQARYHARRMLGQVPSEAERQLDGALSQAEQRLAELRAESARLEARIEQLRGSGAAQPGEPDGRSEQPDDDRQDGGGDVLSELHARIADGQGP